MIGGANEIRTHDLCSAIAALSQLSYGPFAPIYSHGASPVKASRCRASCRFFPGAVCVLPPIADLEACRLGALPLGAGERLGLFVRAIKKTDHAAESFGLALLRRFKEEENRRAVRIRIIECEKSRLTSGMAIASAAMGQEGFVAISPERAVDRFKALRR